MTALAETIKTWARDLGFDDCRVARAGEARHAADFREWIADGHHGEMAWLERGIERRCDPTEVLAGAKSVVCLAWNYFPGKVPETGFRIARYAWNDDYHDLIEDRLRELAGRMDGLGGCQKPYVDTGPVLERDFASDAGLGWNGKSTMQIHRSLGTWFFLAEILTTLDLVPDPPMTGHCGNCTRCLVACPTAAITSPHRLDARRCISYLTIENKGPIPEEFRIAVGDRIYGCDDCLDACPWNRFAVESRETAFLARKSVFNMRLRDFLVLDDDGFRGLFARSPIKRIKRRGFLRNVCVALGNSGTAEDLPYLQRAVTDSETLVSEHATWAIGRIFERQTDSKFR